jgi:hypothetical protein
MDNELERITMRRLMLGTLMALAVPSLLQAAPICVSGSLAEYIALGPGGCTVGGALFADFDASVVDPAATPILPGEVSVSPLLSGTSLGLTFSLTSSVGAGEFEDLLIHYALSGMGLSFVSNTLSMSGSSVTPDGAVTAVEDKCGGGTFGGSDPSAPCSGTLIGPLIVFDIGTIADLTETTSDFAMTSFFDVFTEIAVDGGLDGSASLGMVTTEFGFVPTVIPEPTSMLLLGSGLVAALRRRKRR